MRSDSAWGRRPAACRQLVRRARNHVKADYARRAVEDEEREHLFGAFSEAVRNFDVDALAKVLTEDAVDAGRRRAGKVRRGARPLRGGALIAKAFIGFARLPTSAPAPGAVAHQRPAGMSDTSTKRPGNWCRPSHWRPRPPSGPHWRASTSKRNPDKLHGVLAALSRSGAAG